MSAIVGVIDYRDGWMCLRTDSTDFNEPKRVRQWWRIEREQPGERAVIDLAGSYASMYAGRVAFKMGTGPGAAWASDRPVPRDENGKVTALATEVTDYPCPPVRKGIETRYRNGGWQKYLKSKGWVAA